MSIGHRIRCKKLGLCPEQKYAKYHSYIDGFCVIKLTRAQRCVSDFFLTMKRDEGEERERTVIRIASHWVRREVESYDEAIEVIMKGVYAMDSDELKFMAEGCIHEFERTGPCIFSGSNIDHIRSEITY